MTHLHTIAKSLYLLAATAVLPISMIHLKLSAPEVFSDFVIFAGLFIIFPVWSIIFIVMGLHRLPKEPLRAVAALLGFVLPMIVFSVFSKEPWTAQFYSMFLSALAGIAVYVGYFLLAGIASGKNRALQALGILVVLVSAYFIYVVTTPFFLHLYSTYATEHFLLFGLGTLVNGVTSFLIMMNEESAEELRGKQQVDNAWGAPMALGVMISLVGSFLIAVFV